MGKIKKAAGPKHDATLSPALAKFAKTAVDIPLQTLSTHLATLPRTWPFPRGDLYHWIPLLNRFDNILETFIEEYGLHSGPQIKPFGCSLLAKKGTWPNSLVKDADGIPTEETVREADGRPEADRELIEAVLDFSRLLLDNCGNRSLYNSSDRLNELLNTTSLSLLHANLRLGVKLAQRYHSRQRISSNSQHFHLSLLASHYNLELEKIQKLAFPISRSQVMSKSNKASSSTTGPSAKGKEKEGSAPRRGSTSSPNANDLVALCKEAGEMNGMDEGHGKQPESSKSEWDVWGNVSHFYYPSDSTESPSKPAQDDTTEPTSPSPATPTPVRRSSMTGSHQAHRLSRVSTTEDASNAATAVTASSPEDSRPRNGKTVEIPSSKVATMSAGAILAEYLPDLPQSSKYDLLNKLRTAEALMTSSTTRRQLLAIRILALTNLAYVYPEIIFQTKVLQQDSEEPKRLQLAYQLAELVHSGGNGDSKTPQHIQTLALGALEALTKHKSKVADVCSALNVNVNHGVLLYVTRKAVADMAAEVEGVDSFESHEWREALFSLLSSLPISSPRTADTLVSAGLIQIFVDVLNLRSPSAERVYPKVMQYLDNFVHQVRDAFQTLANAKGLDAIADLTNFEVQSAAECVARGGGLPAEYKTQMTDYDVPFFQQQSLRSLLKFVNHMMQHGGGNFDRLLRNLIDSPQLLSALRKVLENAPMFGSNVWSGVVNIMSSFIHNEPTSYNVISEAGLSKAFLETVMMRPLEALETLKSPTVPPAPPVEDEENSMDTDPTGDDDAGPADPMEELVQNGNSEEPRHREYKVIRSRNAELAKGILPATEAIAAIPQAFGAICLNAAGLQLFRSSNALESFFEIFESPVHVKVMKNDVNLLRILGSSFDEFVRHHPALKSAVMSSILVMVTRVGYKLRSRAWEKGVGTRLWVEGENGQLEISGGPRALYGGLGPATSDEHAEIMDSSKATLLETLLLPSGDKLVGGSDEDIPPLINSKGIGKDEDSSGLAAQNYLSAVVKFLGGFFENQGLCSAFIDAGGVEYILDFATLPSLSFDFGETEAMSELALVIHMMSEMKHHLVLPSLVSRTLDAVRCLAPFYQSNTGYAFFEGLTTRDASANSENESFSKTFSGTYYAKNLVVVHTLTRILHEVYQPHVYHSRPSQATYPFSQVNLGDMYSELVLAFGKLQAACVKNEILLQNSLSDPWKEATRIKGFGMGNSEADQVFGIVHQDENVDPDEKVGSEEMPALIDPANLPNGDSSRATVGEEHKAAFMNVQTLRYLLSTLPSNITSFFHALGKGLMPKRRIDSFQRQSASVVADALADALIDQLKVSKGEFNNSLVDQYAYWIVNLASVSQLMIEKLVERPTQPQCVTMPLLAFQRKHGLKVLEEIAGLFHQEVNSSSDSTNDPTADRRLASAYGGLKIILSFFSQITTSRTIIEAPQTVAMSSNSDRDRDKDKPDYFLPAQFLVELRMAVVPVARRMWHVQAEMVAKAPSSIAKCLVEILKSILDADGEKGAFKRNDNLPQVSATEKAVFKMNRERVGQLVERGGFEKSLAKEALFRCNNLLTAAEEYCKSFKPGSRVPRCPIPTTEIDKSPSRSLNTPRTQEPADAVVPSSSAAAAPNDDTTIMTPALEAIMRGPLNSLFEPGELPGDESTGAAESATPAQIQSPDDNDPADPAVASTMSLGNILNGFDVSALDLQPQGLNAMDATPSVTPNGSRTLPSLRQRQAVRVEDLDTERQVIRDDLIDRCLDVLNVHHDVTFELADLIAAAVRSSKGDDWRIDTGNTLIYSLTSLQGVEDNFQPIGKKIAAYASLAALVLQDQKLYEHIKATLIDTFPAMLGFIKVFPAGPDTVAEDHSPWIGQILLIVEKLLSDDAEPVKINWDPPPPDAPRSEEPIARLEKEEVIPLDQKIELFDVLVEVLPRIGKDASLALSVTRVLVMLTRNRKIATRLGEKRNLQRLFVMIKQLANTTNERLQSSFMLILRHIVEDEDTIRQIMRSEIFSAFNVRPGRHINTTEYLRQLYHVALRAPEIFVDVTNEKLKIPVYETIQRPQNLTLRTSKPEEATTQEDANGSTDPSKPSEDQMATDTTTSVEEGEKQPLEKSKTSEMKAPIVEHPDGVIHYLLSELLSYKDVEDKDTPKPTTAPATSGSSESQSDVEMTNGEGPTGVNAVDLATAVTPKKSDKVEKPEFKGEEHPIYIYRCFILQCLTELLSSYNRTKVEFINFSRKADPLAMTPSKPRSGVLNYLLNSLIPVGTLEHEDSIAFKKRSNTSSWAMRVIVALCSKSGEVVEENRPRGIDEESEPDLLFVRKFVLGHALSAYKEASASTESLDVKYARMMCIADLFDRMLTSNTSADNSYLPTSQRLLAKIMFEKNFITALTSSIADIDLNFPGSKRAVKYILRPLNKLTQTAVILSESSSISTTPGQTDEDDISSASSVSSMEDEREETPDLFRNSTLGMFEQHHNEESSSESSEDDEEMYDDNYDNEMEYEEEGLELDGDVGDVISEEDELDVPGGMEGLPGDVPMNIEVVVDGDEDDEDEEDDSDDEEDSEDDDDDDVNDIGFAGEINGDDDNASLGNGHGEEWQSEEDDEEEEGVFEDGHVEHDGSHGPDSDHLPDIPHFETLLRVMGEEGGEIDQMELEDPITGQDLEFLGDDGPDEEDDEEDEEEDMDEEDVAFEGDFGEDDRGLPTGTWGWELDEPNVHRGPAFHQHHHRGIPSPWSIMPGGAPPHARVLREFNRTSAGAQALIDSLAIPTYRSHRNQGAPRTDDGTNPLLRRADRMDPGVGSARPNGPDALDWVHAIDPISGGRMLPMDSPVTLMNAIMSAIGRDSGAVLPPGGGIQFSMHGPRGERLQAMPTRLQAILGMRPPGTNLGATHTSRNDPSQAVTFLPVATIIRWQEESRILYGNHYFEKAQFLANPILRILVPPAIEEERQRKEEDEKEHHRRVEAERIAKEEADRLKKEQEEKDAKEKEEREAREAREAAEAEAAAAAAAAVAAAAQGTEANGETTQDGGELVPTESTEPMEGVESTDPDASAADTTPEQPEASSSAEAGPSEQTPRVYTTIRGRQLDITDMQIDQEYLDALPEELREEVIMQQLAEQRSQQAATGEEPSEINAEFLEALPPEIREELLQQEAQDRRRREREANRRRAAENGEPRAEEMDGASFIATLDPGLRQAVLADQPEEVLARLGPEFVNEARALTGRRMPHLHDMPRLNRDRHHAQLDQVVRKPQRLKIVQMLDKAGVATLLRLMFMPQQGSGRQYLHGILHDVCENRQNRGEVVSLLLSILQDGSVDVNAVERSFAQLSLRAKQPASQKTPQPLKRTLSMPTAPTTSTDMSPLMVVQQCLSTLVFLTQYNAHIAIFFLTPHESTSGLKSKTQRKGKGKEDKATKYALNALLTLLDRKLIMDSSSCMEQLSSLLSTITQPLTMLLRKDKEKAEETLKADKTDEANALGITAGPTDEPVPRIAGLPGFEAILGPLITATQAEPTLRVQELTDTDALVDATMSDAEARPVESIETATEAPAPPTETVVPSSEQVETTEAAPPANGEGEASAVEKSEEPKKAEEEKPKKRILEPPVIPEHNLRLVVNILAARECNGKTFRETLSSINNLSAIPGAKEVFGKELIAQAQGLSTSILTDLIDLIPHIKEAQTGTEIQGMALAKFSPASSDQAKLLRILTALDYLFDPKRSDSKSKDESFEGKEDLLTTLYESSAFGPLWEKLSECLSAIRQRDNMLNVATILLPLIEALMVVCKNTTLKDTARNIREFSVASPKPESGMEGLFFNFTEDHRKVLNELVRNNPKLMSGTFSLLVKNPKVLEFDNKRNYFSRRLHSRGTERHPQPPLQLSVRREQVFLDSFKSLYFKTPDEMKYGKLSIRFHGEEGVDAGGVTREWFQVLARGMFNPNYALFKPVASDRTTFHPSRISAVNSEHLLFFKFIGRIIGKALYEGRVLDCHFSRAVYKRILGKTVSIKDMETLDLEYYKSLLWMLENDITDVITENFALETDDFGESRTIDLIENGRNIPVTEENKQEYVQLVVEYRLTGSVKEQLENFLKGFHDIIPAELISIFNEQELELLISGLPDIDVDDWKNNSEYHNYSASSSQIQWFWRAVRSFDKEERAKLLQFVTGTSKVPLNGFRELEGMNGFSKFNIHRDYGNKERLPSSHTCFNQLDLPEYETYEQLRQRLYTAMTTGSEYFGFA